MKCPMKFNNPCSDVSDDCEPDCAWRVTSRRLSEDGQHEKLGECCAIAAIGSKRINEAVETVGIIISTED